MAIMTPEEAREMTENHIRENYLSRILSAMNDAAYLGLSECELDFRRDTYDRSKVYDLLYDVGYEYLSYDFLRTNEDELPNAWWSDDEGVCCTYTTVTVTICWS